MSILTPTSAAPYGGGNVSVYRLPFAKVLGAYFILALGVFWIVLFTWFPLSAKNPSMSDYYPWVVLAGFLLFDLCAYISLASLRARLITSPWGIEYYDMGIKLRAPWKSVVGMGEVRYVYRWVDSLVTSQPAEMSRLMRASLMMSKQRYLPAGEMDIDKIRHSIPVGNFVGDWTHSSLGNEVRRYAPQVFGGKEAWEAGRPVGVAAVQPDSHREDETRVGPRRKIIALAVLLAEVLLAFYVAPSLFLSAKPFPLPGQLFFKGTHGPSDLSRDGRFLAAGGQVLTFPEGTSKFKVTLPPRKDGTNQMIKSIALSPDGGLVAAGDENGNAFIWQVADGHLLQTLSVSQSITVQDSSVGPVTIGEVYSVAFSPDGKRLAAVGPTGQIKVWNVNDGKLLSTMKSSRNVPRLGAGARLLFDPSGQMLVSLIEGTLEMWRAEDGSLAGKADPGDWVDSVAMSADGNTLALGTLYGGIYLWDVHKGSVSKTIRKWDKKRGATPEAIYGIAISPDGKTVVSGSSLGDMQVWSVDGGSPKNMRDSSGTTVRWMTFSPDGGKLIYSRYNDDSIWVWAI